MTVKELKELLKVYPDNLKVESSKDKRNLLFLLNENDSCQVTIILGSEKK